MNTDSGVHLKHRELTDKILRCFFTVYNGLGYGYLESVYEKALAVELGDLGLAVESQVPIQVEYRGRNVGDFRADLLVEGAVLIELKAARWIEPAFEAQLLNYLKATGVEVGLLLNFGPKAEFKRLVFDNARKPHP